MIPILALFAIAVLVLCILIAVKPSKKTWIVVGICAGIVVAVIAIVFLGFSNATKDSHVIASVTIGDEKHDMFYDEIRDEYFYIDGHKWQIIYPQYRVILDYKTAKEYAEQYAKLKEFDFATIVEGNNENDN